MFAIRKILGYNKNIRERNKAMDKIDKAYYCPDCNTMSAKVDETTDKKGRSYYISTCKKCGLIWKTK